MTKRQYARSQQIGSSYTEPQKSIASEEDGFRSNFYAWYIVAILSLGNIVSYIDRQIINLLIEPIKRDLSISDTQISLLQGFAFAIFYGVMAIPIGRLADSGNRKFIIAVGMFLWSLATTVCGLARSYGQLFLGRMLVGVGEATLTPSGFSMLSDCFPRKMLTRAISVFTGSSFIGSGIALLIGGFVINQVNTIGSLEVPVIGKIYPWQLAFVIVSVPGLLLALVVATLREPLRRTSEPKGGATSDEHKESFPVREMVAYLIENRASIGSILFGFAILATVQFGLGAWVPTFFIRTYGWTATDIGYVYGLYFVVFGSLGVIVGGWISDWLFARGNRDANLRVGFLAAVLSLPFVLSFPLVHDSMLSVILLAPVSFFGSMPFGAGPAALPMIVPNRMRAQLVALYLLLATLLGQGVGPWLIAVFTDYVMGDPSLIRYSMASVCSVLLVVGASVLWLGRIPFAQKVKELSAE